MKFVASVLISILVTAAGFHHHSTILFGSGNKYDNYHQKSRTPNLLHHTLISMTSSSDIYDTLNVDLGDRSYPIYIGTNLLGKGVGSELRKHIKCKKTLIVTNTKVGPLHLAAVKDSLEGIDTEIFEVVLPDGEEYKTMDVLMMIIDKAMEVKLDRKSTFIALGGGVIGDMTGFAAAIFQRGVKFVQIPTTLMAMVDSAVGGKTAVNHPLGKNMIGSFYQPDAVIIDTNTLNTLPGRELRSGIAEVVKYGLIRDSEFFGWLEENMEKLLGRDNAVVAETVLRSCQNKAAVVAADEREANVRATLNLGHTFGHAIETGLGYGAWLHGEAVSTGMLMAADLSVLHGWIDEDVATRTKALLEKANLPTCLDNPHTARTDDYNEMREGLTKAHFIELMSMDKKVADGKLSLVMLKGKLGNCIITNEFDANKLDEVVTDYVSL